MSHDLLFSSSPFSPYYADRNHPDFLTRVRQAIASVEVAPATTLFAAETSLVRAELRRYTALGGWPHRELFFPGPLTVADVRSDALWLGRTDIPTPETGELDEQIYRIPLSSLSISENAALELPRPVKVGRSKAGAAYNYAEDFGSWVSAEFDHGDPGIGLPPAVASADPQQEKDWGRSRHGGYEFQGMAWRWPAQAATRAGRATERDLLLALEALSREGKPTLGPLQWQGGTVVVPVAVNSPAGRSTFWLFRIESVDPLRLIELEQFRFTARIGVIDVAAATFWRNQWWIPVRVDKGQPNDRVELWTVKASESRQFGTAPFLMGEASADLRADGLSRLAPENPKFVPISGNRAVFGYDHDSLYLIDEQRGTLKVLFHPAKAGLRLADLGEGLILFWTLHARKAYVIDTGG
jgi:hypothetical protein